LLRVLDHTHTHTNTHTHCRNDPLVAEKNITTTLLPLAGFEPAGAAIALDRTATGFDSLYVTVTKINSTTCLMLWTINKGKAVLLQPQSGPEVSRKLRFPDFMTTALNGGKVSLTHRPPLPPGNTLGTHFC
jgi:hypothetical protein